MVCLGLPSLIQMSLASAVVRPKKKRKEKRDAELKIDAVVGVVHSQSESHSRGIVQQNKQQLLQFICHVSSIDWAVWLCCFIHKSTHIVFSLRFVLTNYC